MAAGRVSAVSFEDRLVDVGAAVFMAAAPRPECLHYLTMIASQAD